MPSILPRERPEPLWFLSGGLLLLLAAILALLAQEFRHGEGHAERPIAEFVAFSIASAFVWAWCSLWALRRSPRLGTVLLFAMLLRFCSLVSPPVQEDDIYRYLWEGRLVAEGLDPYAHPPADVLDWLERDATRSAGLGEDDSAQDPGLVAQGAIARESASTRRILERVNHPGFVSIYPPVSQFVFGLAGRFLPVEWGPAARVTGLKLWIGLFELLLLGALLLILRELSWPLGRVIVYAWCPLVLKEIWNSGHMDVLPAATLALGIFALLRSRRATGGRAALAAGLGGVAIGLGVGAKFFPLVLFALLMRWSGIKRSLLWLTGAAIALLGADALLVTADTGSALRRETLVVFALEWEDNAGFFFALDALCRSLLGATEWELSIAGERWIVPAAGLVARSVAGLSITALALYWAGRTSPSTAPALFLRRAGQTLGVFFLLGPLGFPWYFLWAAAFLPFLRRRAWLLLPVVLPIYYLRFHFDYAAQAAGPAAREAALDHFDRYWVAAEFGLVYLGFVLEAPLRARLVSLRKRPGRRGRRRSGLWLRERRG